MLPPSSGSRSIQSLDKILEIWGVVRRELAGMPGGRVGEVVFFPLKEREEEEGEGEVGSLLGV